MRWPCLAFFCAFPYVAYAQYFKNCSEPYEPSVPSGYYQDEWEMENAKAEVKQYISDIEEYQNCLKKNFQEASDSAERVRDEWNGAIRAYNSR